MSLTEDFEIQIEDVEVNVLIPIKRYRTDTGIPTCARNFRANEACPFFAKLPFNPGGKCCLVPSIADKPLPGHSAFVEVNESGFLVPHKDCPLWNEQ